jgi:2-keto-4-pentenoate hydratase/2-oxohepta-3-ene-1,7-dioic acid hydratase in catechol pathway
MKLLTFYQDNLLKLGIKTPEGIVEAPLTPSDFFEGGHAAPDQLKEFVSNLSDDTPRMDEQELSIGAAVPNPGKILCVGLNYRKHAVESGIDIPKLPVLFSKFNNAIAAPGEVIPISLEWKAVDYESELVVVIGKTACCVSVEEALDYVLGYCNGNDMSERDLQFVSGQWLLGKTLDKFLPIGPYLVTADEISDPQNLSIKGWYNGELRQDSSTADMIFSIAEVIAYASRYMTLYPGDIISTGTPEGVIFGRAEKVYMKPGDEYTVEVSGLGRLTNTLGEKQS